MSTAPFTLDLNAYEKNQYLSTSNSTGHGLGGANQSLSKFRPRTTHKSPRYLKSPNGVHYGISTNRHGPDIKTKSQGSPIHTTSSYLWIVVCVTVRLYLIHGLGDLQSWNNVTGYMDTDIKHWIQAFTSATLTNTTVNLKTFLLFQFNKEEKSKDVKKRRNLLLMITYTFGSSRYGERSKGK